MPVGICHIEFEINGAMSLKDKRRVVKSIKDRIRNRFNVSVAEIGDLDRWQRAEIGIACISNDAAYIDGQMASVIRMMETDGRINLIDVSTEIV
ncbi:DUF503 domain-containing protein [bacterium]|nr:DUF503 domain-containing protein [candidate division CSSED10-310 bacterium]